jgi:predicted metal-dependent phosphoesterase TrpH
MRDRWRVDLHMHTRYSPDSLNEIDELISRAREVGLDRIAITDHHTIEGALAARALAPEFVIIGEEIETASGGELIAYFVDQAVPAGLPLDETLRRLKSQGAVVSVSHPVDRFRGSALGEELTISIIDQLDALEVFNSRCLASADNERAAALARQYMKPVTAGSDAHTLPEVGAAYVIVSPFELTPAGLRGSLAEGRAEGRLSGVAPHFLSTVAKWKKGR